MNNAEILRAVAERDLTPEEAADAMLEHDKLKREKARPDWIPLLVWVSIIALGGIVLAACGIERE